MAVTPDSVECGSNAIIVFAHDLRYPLRLRIKLLDKLKRKIVAMKCENQRRLDRLTERQKELNYG